jgi:hypothetical protein
VNDYPYGFRLRCKIRYWLEFKPKVGFRLVSQTTNPKRPGEVWNKPKASTYSRFGGAMVLNEEGHVSWVGLSEYSNAAEAKAFAEKSSAGVPEAGLKTLNGWVAAKAAYEGARKEGDALSVGTKEAFKAFIEAAKD